MLMPRILAACLRSLFVPCRVFMMSSRSISCTDGVHVRVGSGSKEGLGLSGSPGVWGKVFAREVSGLGAIGWGAAALIFSAIWTSSRLQSARLNESSGFAGVFA